MHSCHNCNDESNDLHICKGCNFAIYCGNQCYNSHHDADECISKDLLWTRKNLKEIKSSITDSDVLSELDEFLISYEHVPDLNLKADIVNDLYINGYINPIYMKVLLRTKIGRDRVLKKLERTEDDATFTMRTYDDEQRDVIKDIVYKKDKKGRFVYDPEGNIRNYFESE